MMIKKLPLLLALVMFSIGLNATAQVTLNIGSQPLWGPLVTAGRVMLTTGVTAGCFVMHLWYAVYLKWFLAPV